MEPFTANQFVIQIRHCGHIFNIAHLHSWFRSNVRCPVCRYDIREYNTETQTQETPNTTTNETSNNNSYADILLQSLSNINQETSNPEIINNGNISWSNIIPNIGITPLSFETNLELISRTTPIQTQDSQRTPTNTENTIEENNIIDDLPQD